MSKSATRGLSALAVAAAVAGCQDLPSAGEARIEAGDGLPFPDFPQVYSGAGYFREVGNPRGDLVSTYDFDMLRGVNRETAYYIDRKVLIYNVYDLDPADGIDPDREYFLSEDPVTGKTTCVANPLPLPNVFSRAWWLGNDMVYEGPDVIGGFDAECWIGQVPELGLPVRFCNRADVYPGFAPLQKKLGSFEFYDFHGEEREQRDYPRRFWRLPRACRGL